MLRQSVSDSRGARLWVGVLVLTLACFGCTAKPLTMRESLADFNSEDPLRANAGYMELYHRGAAAIPLLLDNVSRTDVFRGDVHQGRLISIVHFAPSKGRIALYLVEAIRVGHQQPHTTPYLVDDSGQEPADAFPRAVAAYQRWWSALGAPTLEEVRRAPDPLAGTGIQWR